MHQIVFEVKESPEGGYEATALGHHIFTQGEDWDDLCAMVQDAVRCHVGIPTNTQDLRTRGILIERLLLTGIQEG